MPDESLIWLTTSKHNTMKFDIFLTISLCINSKFSNEVILFDFGSANF